ncbi:alpha/beta hydrolase [Crossiella sp. CA-258035]|uniref:alpha/beta hydrolase n=1 Tax=Crossiella sp. CA-258035 TaxID=2981138 RepID=UPI0024BD50D6|nr:alpha/beta hydrolase [Crossiella sp. CA-258035]WHT20043.1 alpha/beta hydrolase [Crossiella sp. CA-258035]
MVTVPVDYAALDGRTIGIALSRIKATDPGRRTSPLQLVGHRHEPVTPYGWAEQLRERVGGELLTVADDHHGSLSSIPCAAKAVAFFRTGKPSSGSCPGA